MDLCWNSQNCNFQSTVMNSHKTRGIMDYFKLFLAISLISGVPIYIILYSSTGSNFNIKTDRFQTPNHSNHASSMFQSKITNNSQTHPEIISRLKEHHLFPPSKLPYNLDKYPNRVGSDSVSKFVRQLLKNQRNGFFIECGANDGEFLSNTITLEMEYGWTGLLVEADPKAIMQLTGKNRRAWVADVCLSVLPYPHKVDMVRVNGWSPMSRVNRVRPETLPQLNMTSKTTSEKPSSNQFTAQCFPLYSILTALNVSVVDYLSLDVEGVELAILKTFPFDSEIVIKVISAEVTEVGTENFRNLIKFLRPKGYRAMTYIKAGFTHDLVFVHKSVETTMKPVAAYNF